ncbi:Uncharacterized protein PBTT_05258 [Plasmodiophora brassicae]
MGDDGSGGGSFLLRAIRSTRVKACAMVTASKENADLLCRAFDDSVRAPARSAANDVRAHWRDARRAQPGTIVGAATAAAMITSIPFGKWAFIRNTIMTAAFTLAVTSPEYITDVLNDTRPRTRSKRRTDASKTETGSEGK